MRYVSIALLLVASTANAENWQQIGKPDSNGGILLFDAARITEVKGLRRAWIKSVYTSDQPIPKDFQGAVRNWPAALAALRQLDVTTGDSTIDLFLNVHVVLLYTLLGALDPAFEQANHFLDRFAESGEIGTPGMWGTLWLPEMRPFRQDSRFAAFATRLGLMDYWKQYGPPDDCELRDGKLSCP